jgi:hypothetical protein
MWTLTGIALLILGVLAIAMAFKKGRQINKDEFGRRNASGVLEYGSFEDSVRAARAKQVNNWLINGATLVIFVGLMLTFFIGPRVDGQVRQDHKRAEAIAAEAVIDAEAQHLAEQCVAGDKVACRKWCAMPGTARTCVRNWGHADGPR